MKRMYISIMVFLLGVPLLLLPAALKAGEQASTAIEDISCESAFMRILEEIKSASMFAMLDTALTQVRAQTRPDRSYHTFRTPKGQHIRRLSSWAAHVRKAESLLTTQITALGTVQSQMLQCAVHCDRTEAPVAIAVKDFNPDAGMSVYRRNIAAALAAFNEARLALKKEARHLPAVHLDQLLDTQAPLIGVIEESLKVCED